MGLFIRSTKVRPAYFIFILLLLCVFIRLTAASFLAPATILPDESYPSISNESAVVYGPSINRSHFLFPGANKNLVDIFYDLLEKALAEKSDKKFLVHPRGSLIYTRHKDRLNWEAAGDIDFVLYIPDELAQDRLFLNQLRQDIETELAQAGLSMRWKRFTENRGIARLTSPDMTKDLDLMILPFSAMEGNSILEGGHNLEGSYFGNKNGAEWLNAHPVNWKKWNGLSVHYLDYLNFLKKALDDEAYLDMDDQLEVRTQLINKLFQSLVHLAYLIGDENLHAELLEKYIRYKKDGTFTHLDVIEEVKVLFDQHFRALSLDKVAKKMLVRYRLLGINPEFDRVINEQIFGVDSFYVGLLKAMRRSRLGAQSVFEEQEGAAPWWVSGPAVSLTLHPHIQKILLYHDLPHPRDALFSYDSLLLETELHRAELSYFDQVVLFSLLVGVDPKIDEPLVIHGKYVFQGFIAGGSQGLVFRLKDLTANKEYALKIVITNVVKNAEEIVRHLVHLNAKDIFHPNVVRYLLNGRVRGRDQERGEFRLFVLEEYLPMKELLHARFGRETFYEYGANEMIQAIMHALGGLAFLLDHQIIHTDPQSLMVGEEQDFRNVLFDFGQSGMLDLSPIDDSQLLDKIKQFKGIFGENFYDLWFAYFSLILDIMIENNVHNGTVTTALDEKIKILGQIESGFSRKSIIALSPFLDLVKMVFYTVEGDAVKAYPYYLKIKDMPEFHVDGKRFPNLKRVQSLLESLHDKVSSTRVGLLFDIAA